MRKNKMTKYTTIEGHPVEVGKKYITRNGEVVKVVDIDNGYVFCPIVGDLGKGWFRWTVAGRCFDDTFLPDLDLMRPYEENSAKLPDLDEGWIEYSLKTQNKKPTEINDNDVVDVVLIDGKTLLMQRALDLRCEWGRVVRYRVVMKYEDYLKKVGKDG